MGLDLFTLAEYKAYMGITNPSDDAAISALIPKVSNIVKTICKRTFVDYVNDSKVEVSRGGKGYLDLSEYPVLSVSSVEFSDTYGQSYTTLTEFIDYIVDAEAEKVVFIAGPYNSNVSQPNRFKVTYTAGYEELPVDLKLALFDLVTYYRRGDGAIHSHKNPGSNTVLIDYITNNKLPAHISRILELYMAHYG
jgi:hypothetical protein